jgi:hypothetical protein
MNIVRNLVVIAALIAAAFLIGRTADAQQDRRAPRPPVWEYRDGANLTLKQLNDLGADGWELARITTTS